MEHIVKCKLDYSIGGMCDLPVKGMFYTCTSWTKSSDPDYGFTVIIKLKEFPGSTFDMNNFYTPDIDRYADKLEWIESVMAGYEGTSEMEF